MSESLRMTAQQANELLKKQSKSDVDTQLDRIEEKVWQAIKEKKDFIMIRRDLLLPETVEALKELGYGIKTPSSSHGPRTNESFPPYTTISFGGN